MTNKHGKILAKFEENPTTKKNKKEHAVDVAFFHK